MCAKGNLMIKRIKEKNNKKIKEKICKRIKIKKIKKYIVKLQKFAKKDNC